MRFPISCLVVGLVAASLGVSHAAPVRKIVPQGAVSFTSKATGFSVWLPGQVFQNKRIVPLKDGTKMTIFIFQTKAEPIAYALIVSPKPPQVNLADSAGPLDAMQRGGIRSAGGTLQKREEIRLGDFPGREIQHSAQGGASVVRNRFYLTSQNSYQIIAGGKKAEMQKQSAQITRVFDSFRILPPK